MFDQPPGVDDLAAQTKRVIDQDGNDVGAWQHQVISVDGMELEARTPSPQALQAFSSAISSSSPATLRNDMTSLFIRRHLSPESHEKLMEKLMDPDGSGTDERTLSRVLKAIATLGTGRPSGPSRDSQPRRRSTGAPSELG